MQVWINAYNYFMYDIGGGDASRPPPIVFRLGSLSFHPVIIS